MQQRRYAKRQAPYMKNWSQGGEQIFNLSIQVRRSGRATGASSAKDVDATVAGLHAAQLRLSGPLHGPLWVQPGRLGAHAGVSIFDASAVASLTRFLARAAAVADSGDTDRSRCEVLSSAVTVRSFIYFQAAVFKSRQRRMLCRTPSLLRLLVECPPQAFSNSLAGCCVRCGVFQASARRNLSRQAVRYIGMPAAEGGKTPLSRAAIPPPISPCLHPKAILCRNPSKQ